MYCTVTDVLAGEACPSFCEKSGEADYSDSGTLSINHYEIPVRSNNKTANLLDLADNRVICSKNGIIQLLFLSFWCSEHYPSSVPKKHRSNLQTQLLDQA